MRSLKQLAIIFFTVASLFTLNAQASAADVNEGERLYSTAPTEGYRFNNLQLSRNGYLGVITQNPTQKLTRFQLLDSSGNVCFTIDGTYNQVMSSAFDDEGYPYLEVGQFGGSFDLIKFDIDGSVIWKKNWARSLDIEQIDDSYIYAMGSNTAGTVFNTEIIDKHTGEAVQHNTDLYPTKVDQRFIYKFETTYYKKADKVLQIFNKSNDKLFDVTFETSDSKYIDAGSNEDTIFVVTRHHDSNLVPVGVVTALDFAGNMKWKYTTRDVNVPSSILPYKGGLIVCIRSHLVALDKDGAVKWEQDFDFRYKDSTQLTVQENGLIAFDRMLIDPDTGSTLQLYEDNKQYHNPTLYYLASPDREHYVEVKKLAYGDILGHWAYAPMKELINKGILSGVEGTSISPDYSITREQFVKMLVSALGIETASQQPDFQDVELTRWSLPYIRAAVQQGIIVPDEEGGNFRPDSLISRQDMAIMISRALKLQGNPQVIPFSDQNEITKHPELISSAIKAGIIGGYEDNTFHPWAGATRAEAAVMIVRALNHQ